MSNQTRVFNEGELTSNTIDRQFTPEFVSKTIVEQPARQTVFMDRGNRDNQPENHGDKFTMEVRFPVLNKGNMIDGGIDANGAIELGNEWYVYNAAGALQATFTADMYLAAGTAADYPAAVALAKAAATTSLGGFAGGSMKSGAGSIRNGSNSFLVEKGALTPIPETGGQMNEVNGSSKLVSAKVDTFGANSKYTVKSVKLDSRLKLIGRTIQDLGRYRKEAQEGQARTSVIAAAHVNRMMASDVNTTASTLDGADILTYSTFEAWEQDIQNAEIPLETKIVSGSTKIDTKIIDGAYIVYINKEILPTLRKIKGPDNTTIWTPVSKYTERMGTSEYNGLHGEVGAFDGLPFRFVIVQDMPINKGVGSEVGAVGDNGTALQQAQAYKTNDGTVNKYDVFDLVVIGDDCYTTLSYGWGNVTAEHVKPQRIIGGAGSDIYATKGAIVTQWSYGFLAYRPERIRSLSAIATRNGN